MCWELREREAEPGRKTTIMKRMTMTILPGADVWRGGGGADATSALARRRGGEEGAGGEEGPG